MTDNAELHVHAALAPVHGLLTLQSQPQVLLKKLLRRVADKAVCGVILLDFMFGCGLCMLRNKLETEPLAEGCSDFG